MHSGHSDAGEDRWPFVLRVKGCGAPKICDTGLRVCLGACVSRCERKSDNIY